MTVETLLDSGIDIQVAVHYYYFDDGKQERVEISSENAMDKEILYMYCEHDELCIEVDYKEVWKG